MAKGRMLSKEEILNMNGKYVYIKPCVKLYSNDTGKAQVIISNIDNIIEFHTQSTMNCWEADIFQNSINNGTWLDVYEWIEENKDVEQKETVSVIYKTITQVPQRYSGIEILQMIKDGDLKEGDKFIGYMPTSGNQDGVFTVKSGAKYFYIEDDKDENMDSWDLLNMTFIIKTKEYMTFDAARKTGKKFKHVDWCDYYKLDDALRTLATYNLEQINEIIDGLWEVEE